MLKLSNDRKVSPLSVWKSSSKRWEPMVPNAFGLPAGRDNGTCPGETPFCNGCYAARTEKVFTSAGRLVNHNYDLLKAYDSAGSMALILAEMVDRFIVALEKAERKTGKTIDRIFRIHWDGDLFSSDYARAWARVMRQFPTVQFWLYTRSFEFIAPFEGIVNVTVYLSVDEHNADLARIAKAMHPFVKLAFCADTWEATEAVAATFEGERKGPRCPELTGKLPMVNADGVGACVACGLCIYGMNNVRFAKEKVAK